MIVDGNSKPIFNSNVPNVSDALNGWFQLMTVSLIVKTITTYQVVETSTTLNIQAVRQPLQAKQLLVKPEGQRAWNWETLHVKDEDNFNVDDVIVFNSVRYRIMNKWPWPEYGYYEYHIVQDFTP